MNKQLRLLVVLAAAVSLQAAFVPGADALGSSTWAKLSPAAHPGGRYYPAMAYDQANKQLVLFGGYSDGLGTFLNDTWVWNGTTWTKKSPATVPSVRDAALMTYDPNTGHVIMFGGFTGGGYHQQMWSWNGTDWTLLAPAHMPLERAWGGMVVEPDTNRVILYGGWNGAFDLSDTWAWNGTDWSQLTPAHNPGARDDFALVPDPVHHKIVMFSGYLNGVINGDTWTWNGTDWAQVATSGPAARADMQATFDPRLGRVVMFGGFIRLNSTTFTGFQDTWSWTGTSWQSMTMTTKPSRRDAGAMAYFPPKGTTVLFGGYDEYTSGIADLSDTWVLNLATGSAAPAIATSSSATKTFTVSWGAPGAPTSYVVQYATRVKNSSGAWVNGPWTAWKNVSGSTKSASFTGSLGQTYLFHAKAVYAGGASTSYSPTVTAVEPYDDRSAANVFSSGWTSAASAGRFLGTVRYTTAANKSMTISTDALSFSLIGDKCASCGKFRVYIDGVLVTTMDSYKSTTASRQVLYSKTFSSTKKHTLKIVTLATAGRPKVVVDAVAVRR